MSLDLKKATAASHDTELRLKTIQDAHDILLNSWFSALNNKSTWPPPSLPKKHRAYAIIAEWRGLEYLRKISPLTYPVITLILREVKTEKLKTGTALDRLLIAKNAPSTKAQFKELKTMLDGMTAFSSRRELGAYFGLPAPNDDDPALSWGRGFQVGIEVAALSKKYTTPDRIGRTNRLFDLTIRAFVRLAEKLPTELERIPRYRNLNFIDQLIEEMKNEGVEEVEKGLLQWEDQNGRTKKTKTASFKTTYSSRWEKKIMRFVEKHIPPRCC